MRDYKTCLALPIENLTIQELRQHIKECKMMSAEPNKKKVARDLRRRAEACIVELNRKALMFVET